jgi:glycosyltransferase involved in cell wall biosynthesis
MIPRFILVSEFSRSLLPARAQARATVVRGGIDTDRFRYSDGPRQRRVVQIGRIMPHKGIDYLIEACGSDIPLTVAGRVVDQAYYDHLRRLGDGRQVTFLIEPDDQTIYELYATSAATVAASVYRDHAGKLWPQGELMGLTLLESMAVGTPVICTRVGGMPEYVVDGEVGYVVPPNDPTELRTKIMALLSDPNRATAMGSAGRSHAKAFAWPRVAEQVATEYTRLVGTRQD